MNRYILIRRLRGPAFLLLVGINALLAQAHIIGWGHSWPFYLILAGVIALAERAALATSEPMPPPPYAGEPYPGAPYPNAPYPNAPYPGSPYPGSPNQGSPNQGSPYQGVPYPGAPAPPASPSTAIVPTTHDFDDPNGGHK
jgi:hypothetical protein